MLRNQCLFAWKSTKDVAKKPAALDILIFRLRLELGINRVDFDPSQSTIYLQELLKRVATCG